MSAISSPRAFRSSTCVIRRKPKPVGTSPAPPNTWTLHLQQFNDLLLVVHAKDMFAQPESADEKDYYKGKIDSHGDTRRKQTGRRGSRSMMSASRRRRGRSASCRSRAGAAPLWYIGGRWAYASALLDGFSDYIMITIDLADPTKPLLAGKYWLPGMNIAAGEVPNWPSGSAASGCITRSCMATSPIARGAMRVWPWWMSATARAETDRPQDLGAAVRRRHPQRAAAARTANC